ncbi:MAG: efflux RND transporter periplasmic adaptor subunit [Omnitrophica WOR_2 bacterium]
MRAIKQVFYLAFIFFLFLSGCSGPDTYIPLETEQLSVNSDQEQSIYGKVMVARDLKMSFPVSGHVEILFVKKGDTVKAGDRLAQLDTTALDYDVARAQANLGLAKANLQKVMTGPRPESITQAQNDVTAARSVVANSYLQATAQAANLAAAEARLELLKAQPFPEDVAVAQAAVDQAKIDVESAMARLGQATLVAPIDGTIVDTLIESHEYASAGTPVIQLSNTNDLIIQATMDEYIVYNLEIGDRVLMSFPALPGVSVQGTVTSMLPVQTATTTSTGQYTVFIGMISPPKTIRWGMTAEINIQKK